MKYNKAQVKRISVILVIVLSLTLFSLFAYVTFTDSIPSGNITTSNSSIIIQQNFSTNGEGLSNINWSWDGTNYSIYDPSLVLFYNFDNRSSLSENDTVVKDLSIYGNNGTVFGGINVTYSPNGKYNSALIFNDSYGYALSNNYLSSVSNYPFTISAWFNHTNNLTFDGGVFLYNTTNVYYGFIITSANKLRIAVRNATFFYSDSSSSVNLNQWNHISLVFVNSTTRYAYINGNLFYTYNNNIVFNGASLKVMIGMDNPSDKGIFNGLIDDVMIFNRSLSASEISQLYKSSLTKYNSQNWSFTTNQSLNYSTQILNVSNPTFNNQYYICSSNSTGSENCTSQKVITQTIPTSTLTTNFSNSIGNVRNDFYGVNIQNSTRLMGPYTIDTDCDGVEETTGDYLWSQNSYLNGGYGSMRLDYYFDDYYTVLNNFGFEEWSNTSIGFSNHSGGTGARSWYMNLVGGNRNATIYQTTDAHSGNYALQINGSSGSGNQYVSNSFAGTLGYNYTYSVWLKGQGTVILHIWDSIFVPKVSKSVTLTNTWTQYNVSWYNTNATTTFYMGMDLGVSANVTMDDYAMYKNNTPLIWDRKGNTTILENQLIWDLQNNKRPLVIFWSNNPSGLANWSDPNCDGKLGTGDTSCMPYDWDVTNNISLDAIKRLTRENTTIESNLDLEFKNEPYGNLGNYSYDSIPLALAYVQFYNNTYTVIKAYNSNIQMGGPSGFQMTTTPNILRTFFSNMSNRFDFVTAHPYSSNYKGSNNMYNYFYNIQANCTALGGGLGCNIIINGEWETYNEKNISNGQSNDFKSEIAMAYQSVLNWNPSNVSMHYYHWFDTVSYFNCPSRYSEYPAFWSGVSEAGLDNPTATYYPPYNVTKSFATYCPAGSTVYSSSSDDDTIKTVTCKDGNMRNVILINTGTTSKNVTINLTNSGITTLKNYDNFSETWLTKENITSFIGNNSLFFDGINNYVNFSKPSNLQITNNITVSTWVNFNDTVGKQGILGIWAGSVSTSSFILKMESNVLSFYSIISGVSTAVSYPYTDINKWHYITGNYNGTSLNIFVDGLLVNSTSSVGNLDAGSSEFYLGRYKAGGTYYYLNGSLDEVRIYNVSLTNAQIVQINNSGRIENSSLPSTGLMLWAPINESSGNIINDFSGYGSNGIISGATWINEGTTTTTTNNLVQLGIMDSYDILYLGEDLQSPTITVQSPVSGYSYSTTNINFNLTGDEELSYCVYSLNNFLTNYTMAKQGYVNEFKAVYSAFLEGNNTANFWCTDMSGNVGTASISFNAFPSQSGNNPGFNIVVTNSTNPVTNNNIIVTDKPTFLNQLGDELKSLGNDVGSFLNSTFTSKKDSTPASNSGGLDAIFIGIVFVIALFLVIKRVI